MGIKESILDLPHSACVDCVFALFHNMSQTGCKLNKLDMFKNNPNVEVLEAEDGEREFYIIAKSQCFWKRGKKWAEKQEGDLVEKVIEETEMKYDVIVYLDDYWGDNVPIYDTVENILQFTRKPEKIIVVNNSSKMNISQVAQWLNITCSEHKQKFVLKDIVDKTETNWSAISRAGRECKSMFTLFIEAGQTIDTTAMEAINKKLFEEIDEFTVIKFNYNAVLCLKSAYDMVSRFDVNFIEEIYHRLEVLGIADKFKTYKQYICQE